LTFDVNKHLDFQRKQIGCYDPTLLAFYAIQRKNIFAFLLIIRISIFFFESGERPKRVIYISKFSDIEMSTFQFFTSDFDSKLTVAVSEKYLQMMEKKPLIFFGRT
jgi:hypothetical protein